MKSRGVRTNLKYPGGDWGYDETWAINLVLGISIGINQVLIISAMVFYFVLLLPSKISGKWILKIDCFSSASFL